MKTLALLALLSLVLASQSSGLKIVVIEGEDAVNVIQQKTAVAPLVEVRDRNNQPVAGAIVTFTIDAGKNAAVAGGAQTVTVTTNAAGQAAMAAINPVNSGAFQIQVQAAFQGQTAVATIAQTNVLAAAQAATATAAGAGGGGGMSGLLITGIVSGVGVVGTVVAVGALASGDSASPDVIAAAGTYTLQQINGSPLPALTVASPPNLCPGFTDSATLTLGTNALGDNREMYELAQRSHTECRLGPGPGFDSVHRGDWSVQGGTITFTGQLNPGPGTLSGSTLTFAFDAPHAEAGNPALRVSSTWRK